MASFRRGAEAIQAATKNTGSGKFTPVFKFEEGETKYVQFLTSIEDVPTVLMHQFIIVGHREDGNPKYERFISRRDPALDGAEGYDELIDRFGSNPSQRCIALAVELEPQFEKKGTKKVLAGFDVAMREYTDSEGNEKEVPNVALVIESPYTLYTHLTAFSDLEPIEDVIFGVKVTGKGKDKTYTLMRAGEAIDFEDELDEFIEEIDFEAWLDELADEERMKELISPLPDDFVVNKYAKKGKGKKEEASSGRSTRSRRAVEDEEPEAGDDSEEAEEAVAEAKPSRTRRFQQLRSEAGK